MEESITHVKATAAATASHTSCPSSPAAATLPEKTQCFVLRLPPEQVPCHIHAEITMRLAAPRAHSRSHYNAICNRTLQNTLEEPITHQSDRSRNCPSSLAAATLPEKTQCFVLRLPPQHKSHAIFPKSPLPKVTTSLSLHCPKSPLPKVTTSLRHHFSKSPLL